MEPTQHGSLRELVMAPQRELETEFAVSDHQYFPGTEWSYESSLINCNDIFLDFATTSIPYSQLKMLTSQVEAQATFASCPTNEKQPYLSTYTPPYQVLNELEPTTGYNVVNVHKYNINSNDIIYDFKERRYTCSSSRDERELSVSIELPVFSIGSFEDKRGIRHKVKKAEGQPSKNLMAERRRRKRLNDRLSMLRSVVPRISKMDRTSILGDTIDYMKELLEKIHKLKMKDTEVNSYQLNSLGNINNISEATTKNSSKFDVKRKDKSTEIDISCPAKPGMVLSTLNTIETLGLDIQQCVVSCFSDFSLEASCSEAEEHRRFISSEDLSRALSRNAGYGGRYL